MNALTAIARKMVTGDTGRSVVAELSAQIIDPTIETIFDSFQRALDAGPPLSASGIVFAVVALAQRLRADGYQNRASLFFSTAAQALADRNEVQSLEAAIGIHARLRAACVGGPPLAWAEAAIFEATARLRIADLGVDRVENLRQAVLLYHRCLQSVVSEPEITGPWRMNEASARSHLAHLGIEAEENLRQAISLYRLAFGAFAQGSSIAGRCQRNGAQAYLDLAGLGIDPEQNVREAIRLCRHAFGHFDPSSPDASRCLRIEADAYVDLAQLGIDPEENFGQGIRLCRQALNHLDAGSPRAGRCLMAEARGYSGLARLGIDPERNLHRTIVLYQQALGCFAADSLNAGSCLASEANAELQLARLGIKPEHHLRHAIELYPKAFRSLHPDSPSAVGCQMNEANALVELARIGVEPRENLGQAISVYTRVLKSFTPGSPAEATCQVNIANLCSELAELGINPEKNLERAIDFCQQALGAFPLGSPDAGRCMLNEAGSRAALATHGVESGENLKKAEDLARAATTCLEHGSIDWIKACHLLAVVLKRQHRLDQAHAEIAEAIKTLESINYSFLDESSRRAFRQEFRSTYRLMVSLCIDLSDAELAKHECNVEQSEAFRWEALKWVFLSKARTLQERLALWCDVSEQVPKLAAELDDLLREFSRMKRAINSQRKPDESSREQKANDESLLRNRICGLVAPMRLAEGHQIADTEILFRKKLADDVTRLGPSHRVAVVVEFFEATEGRLGVFIQPGTGISGLKDPIWLKGGRQHAAKLAEQCSRACEVLAREGRARTGSVPEPPPSPGERKEARATLEIVAGELGEMLLEVREVIDEHWENATLILCPSGPLHLLPLAAAHWGGTVVLPPAEGGTKAKEIPRTLIDAHPLVHLPTAALALEVAQRMHPLTQTAYVAAADPFGTLREIWEEATSVRQLLERRGFEVKCVEGEQATACSLWEHGGDSWIIHLAMHTGMDDVFNFCGAEFDDRRFLVLELLSGLRFRRAALAVVATCSSSQPLDLTADDPSALTRAWMLAGATSVIGSLWPLVDERAKEFW